MARAELENICALELSEAVRCQRQSVHADGQETTAEAAAADDGRGFEAAIVGQTAVEALIDRERRDCLQVGNAD